LSCVLRKGNPTGSLVDAKGYTVYLKKCKKDAPGDNMDYPFFDDGFENINKSLAREEHREFTNIEDIMEGFWAAETITIHVGASTTETLYETFFGPLKAKTFSGVFYSASDDESDSETISISVLDPDGVSVFSTKDEVQGAFKLPINNAGTYQILIKNSHLRSGAWVTMMFAGEKLKEHHMEHLEAELSIVEKLLTSIKQEDTYLWHRQSTALHAISGMNLTCLALRTFEFLVMTFMAAVQIIFVRSLCAHRRII